MASLCHCLQVVIYERLIGRTAQCFEFFLDLLAVGRIGHAEPISGCRKHFAVRLP